MDGFGCEKNPYDPAAKGRHKNLGCTLKGQLARRRRLFYETTT